MIAVRVLDTTEDAIRQLSDEHALLVGGHMLDSLEMIRKTKLEKSKNTCRTFWTTRQPYICSESGKTWPSIVFASKAFWTSLPCSKNFWIT